ncbi:MAG: ABC transporter permease [Thermobacillus sp.]|uniref:ABC-type multidrug transport system, permease component n=1 Tax=Thermobacillus composti (strain DSM 18247 / JCM 13945 / KWC4) TaxID=717605 RepID=L0EFC2_THECK|nr:MULTISPECIES: ABC transporter permease [Thermobacillus]AGA58376.1 ABC-type multidrug transport system, permease component [Thermobacillus composti KWC4]REK54763.1 MAG: ABC transporter permease [Thermobacillus sp.]
MAKNMKQLRMLFDAQLKETFRERQVWFWSIMFPVLLLVIFMIIFGGNSDFSAKVAIVGDKSGAAAEAFVQSAEATGVLKIEQDLDLQEAEKRLKEKRLDAVFVLPDSSEAGDFRLLLNAEGQTSSTSQALGSIAGQLTAAANQAATGIAPAFDLKTEYVSASHNRLKVSDFLLSGVIALSIAQSGLFGMVGLVEIRRKGLLKRLKMTPVNMRLFGVANVGARFVLSIVQVILLTLIGVAAFRANVDFSPLTFLLIFIVGTLAFSGLGYLISAASKTLESYMGISNLVSFIMMFLSGIFIDVNVLPGYLKPVSHVMPLTYFVDGIRAGMIYGSGMNADMWLNLAVLAAWGVASFLLATLLFRRRSATW